MWPLSTDERPKQFVDLFGSTLFDRALHRIDNVPGSGDALVVTGSAHLHAVEGALAQAGVSATVLCEPVGRNTGPAVIAAAIVSEPDDVLVVLPSDHLIEDVDQFANRVEAAVGEAQEGRLVTFGIPPTRAETGYGYIELGERSGEAHIITSFHEKPSRQRAEAMAADGKHLWNSGMFVFTAETLLGEAARHAPSLYQAVRKAVPAERRDRILLDDSFADVESISIDHAIMERTTNGVVIPIDVGWSDVGSFQSLHSVSLRDQDGNAVTGEVVLSDVRGSLVHAGTRKVAVIGVDGLAVIDTPEAVLVVPLDLSQRVRDIADQRHQD